MAYNRLIIEGRLTADPDLRQTTSGIDVCSATVAVDRPAKRGDKKEADFFNITAWRGTAQLLATYFHRGDGILVEGQLQSRKYVDKNGIDRVGWELKVDRVHFTEGRHSKQDVQTGASASYGSDFSEIDDNEDLPF